MNTLEIVNFDKIYSMDFVVNCLSKKIKGQINLPASKSISNRLLILKALSGGSFQIHNLSESDDTAVMEDAFKNDGTEINIGHAGTSMRFLTAYYAATQQKKILTGSERMKNRPIQELVESLNQLGAEIKYTEKQGYPPVITSGKELKGNTISIHGGISSQFITALILTAPILPHGLEISIQGKLISASYVNLTLQLMKSFGIEYTWDEQLIRIPHQEFRPHDYMVESDWSAASYWYQIAALAMEADISLSGLFSESLQGDAQTASLFERLGIRSTFSEQGVTISKIPYSCDFFEYNFTNNPDLVQTFVVTLCLLNIPFCLSGAESLRIKETDRISAIQQEMKKLGFPIRETKPGVLEWKGERTEPSHTIAIDTYKDHRMALAFAPASLLYKNLIINDALVVTKSYPNYWKDLTDAGFEIHPKLG